MGCRRRLAVLLVAVLVFSGVNLNFEKRASAETTQEENVVYTPITDKDFLKTNGTKIRNESGLGKVVQLRGVTNYYYTIQEYGMTQTSFSDGEYCMQNLVDILYNRSDIGKDKAEALFDIYEESFWTEEDFIRCVEYGVNCIKLPIWYGDFTDVNGNWKNDAFERIDWFIKKAKEYGIYIELCMAGAYGGQSNMYSTGCTGDEYSLSNYEYFYGSNASRNQNLTLELWRTIASRYKDEPAIAGYSVLDKPVGWHNFNDDNEKEETLEYVYSLMDGLYDAIRSVDSNHIIFMCSQGEIYDIVSPDVYGWVNVVYEYSAMMIESSGAANRYVSDISLSEYNVPVMFGETMFFDKRTMEYSLELFNQCGYSWLFWSYKCSRYGQTDSVVDNQGLGLLYISENAGYANVNASSYSDIARMWSKNNIVTENTEYLTVFIEKCNIAEAEDVSFVELKGYQINTSNWGFRIVSSVYQGEDDFEIVEYGNLLGFVTTGITTDNMNLDDLGEYIVKCVATEEGVLQNSSGESENTNTYVMTMINNGYTSAGYTQKYMVRPYAILSDGTVIYGNVGTFSIFDVAKTLYDNSLLSSKEAHSKVYQQILITVDKAYESVEYNGGYTLCPI